MKIDRCKRISAVLILCIVMSLFTTSVFAGNVSYKSFDARRALRMAAMLEKIDKGYDLNFDGRVTATDAREILKIAARIDPEDSELIADTGSSPAALLGESKISVSGSDLLTASGLTEAQLKNGLKKSLKQYAATFIEAENTYNINAVFLASIAALESGWGESYLAKTKNNLFGWRGNGGYRSFDSVPDCILYVAKFLKTNYLTPGGSCFNGYTVEAVEKSYCPGFTWASQVKELMNLILGSAV